LEALRVANDQTYSARDWLSILRTLYTTQNLQGQCRTDLHMKILTECILDKIDVYRRNWLLHLQRMPRNRIPLKSYRYSPQGKRTVGIPKKRWREQL
jgi:hypothetical protein